MVRRLIAISGYARAGKDTVARILAERGYEYLYFADALRAVAYASNPWVGWDADADGDQSVRLSQVIDVFGWDGYKATVYGTEIRRFMQELGTEGCRKNIGDLVWVQATLDKLHPDKSYAFPDCRFPNEAAAVKLAGGEVWRVNRAGVGPVNDHPSETALDDYPFDHIISNHGSLESLRSRVLDAEIGVSPSAWPAKVAEVRHKVCKFSPQRDACDTCGSSGLYVFNHGCPNGKVV